MWYGYVYLGLIYLVSRLFMLSVTYLAIIDFDNVNMHWVYQNMTS